MKSFKKILSEVAQPKSGEEKAFKDQHVVDVIDHPAAEKSQFTGEIEGKTKKKRIADYYAGDDVKAYDKAYSQKDKPFKMPRNESVDVEQIDEKAVSQAQQKLMAMALSLKRGEMDAADASDAVKNLAKTMSMKDLEDFASTKHKDLPAKVESEKFVSDDGVSHVPHPVEPEGHKSKKLSFKDMLGKVTQTEETTEITEDADEEIEMMEGQLHFIIYAAEEIMEYLDMVDDPEEWYQNKLAGVFYEMKALHSYAEGEKRMYDMEPTDLDHVGDVYGYGEEVEQSEEDGELTEAMKAGTLKLKNGDAVKLSEKDAKILNKMLGELNEKNRKQMEKVMMTDKNGFNEILGFAKEVV